MKQYVSNYFMFDELKTSYKTETLAGITTFMAMAYILFVNPAILEQAGMDRGAVFVATALSSVIGSLIIGILAKYPMGVAPGMGLNSFFTTTIVIGMGIPWQTALAGTLFTGILFCIFSITGLRDKVVDAIPNELKMSLGAGIGLFITFIGLKNSGIVVYSAGTLLTLGDVSNSSVLLALFGLLFMIFLYAKKVPGSIFVAMITTAILGMLFGIIDLPTKIVSSPPSLAPTFGQAFLHFPKIFTTDMIIIVLIMFFVDFVDTAGLLVAVAQKTGFMKEDGKIPRANKAFFADASSTVVGAVLGTSTATPYTESFAGISVGGKSGFTSVVIAALFMLSLFFSPLMGVMTNAVTAPALIVIGVLMAGQLKEIDWNEFEIAAPAFFTIVMMPFTGSIATGMGFGFIVYPVVMIAKGKTKEMNPFSLVMSFLFILYFASSLL